jgi:aspartate-semialdehyde dehydrogenase
MRLGIVGITGLVGEKIIESLKLLKVLDKCSTLRLFASEASKGRVYKIQNNDYVCEQFYSSDMKNLDYIILAVENDIARNIIEAKKLEKHNCVIIDNSSEYRMDADVPLIIPEINIKQIMDTKLNKCKQIIANPNCSTTMLAMLLAPLMKITSIEKVNVSTYQAASGAGKKGLDELLEQTKEYVNSKPLTTTFWKKQYIFNVFSHNSKIGENFYNQEEMKMVNETRKILSTPNLIINPTCIRVPTLTSHCLSVNVTFDRDVDMNAIYHQLQKFPGLVIEEDYKLNMFPEPIKTSNKTDISVGRIRPELDVNGMFNNKCWNFFISGDQLLKGAAYNSVQILKLMSDLQ